MKSQFKKLDMILDTIVMDEHILEQINRGNTKRKANTFELKIVYKLYKYQDDQRFIELEKKLEELKDKYYRNAISSLEFLKLAMRNRCIRAGNQS